MTMTDPLALSGLTIDQAELTGDRPITPDDLGTTITTNPPKFIPSHITVREVPYSEEDRLQDLAAEKDDEIAQLRAELTALTAQRDELLAMVDQKNSELAELRSKLFEATEINDDRLDRVERERDELRSELAGLRDELLTLRAQTRQDANWIAAQDATITELRSQLDDYPTTQAYKISDLKAENEELRSQIDKLTTAALEPQPPANIEAIMAMINQQHQLIAKLDQHLAIALGMADYRAALGQLG